VAIIVRVVAIVIVIRIEAIVVVGGVACLVQVKRSRLVIVVILLLAYDKISCVDVEEGVLSGISITHPELGNGIGIVERRGEDNRSEDHRTIHVDQSYVLACSSIGRDLHHVSAARREDLVRTSFNWRQFLAAVVVCFSSILSHKDL
jgi:hypothetical protein